MATRTLLQIIQAVADTLHARESGTATAGGAGTLTCATYPFITNLTNADSTRYVGDEMYITAGTSIGDRRQITTYVPSTGVFTASANWTATPTTSSTFDIYSRGLMHDWLKDRVNEALAELTYRTISPLTLVTDGDMETSGVGSWTATGSTFTKVTTAGSTLRGTQSGRVANSGAAGQIQSATINTVPGTTYILWSACRAAVGEGSGVGYDVTSSANIDTESWDEIGWGGVYFTFTVPSTCEQIAVRLVGTAITADIYWDNVILLPQGATTIDLPDWITRPGQIAAVVQTPMTAAVDKDDYRPVLHWDVLSDPSNPNVQFKLQVAGGFSRPTYLIAERYYSELATDAATTFCPRRLIEEAATVKTLDRLINLAPAQEVDAWKIEYGRRRRKLYAIQRALTAAPTFRRQFPNWPNVPVSRGL